MEKKMETAIGFRVENERMEKKGEATIMYRDHYKDPFIYS